MASAPRMREQFQKFLDDPSSFEKSDLERLVRDVASMEHGELSVMMAQCMTTIADLDENSRSLIQKNAVLKERSLTHELTGLPNKTAYYERLNNVLERMGRGSPSQASVIYIDLNYLKYINDNLGHGAGDKALCTFARHLKSFAREQDLPVHFSGDEFGLILTDETGKMGHFDEYALQRLRRHMDGLSMQCEEETIPLKASMGMAAITTQKTAEQITKEADDAMFADKQSDRDPSKEREISPPGL